MADAARDPEARVDFDVVVSGHLCLDLLPRMQHVALSALDSPGRLFEVDALDVSTGGAVSNTGLALHRLGANVRLMASVGADLIGRATYQFIAERDPALTEHLRIANGATSSYSIVLSSSSKDRVFLHCTGVNSVFDHSHIDYEVVARARVFHLGYPPILPYLYANNGTELVEIYRLARATGVVTSLDMSLPDIGAPSGQANWSAIVADVLPFVDVFVPSIDEIVFMLRPADYARWQGRCASAVSLAYVRELADELVAYGASIVGLKLGDRGIYLRGAGRLAESLLLRTPVQRDQWCAQEVYQPAFAVDVVGTTGAGDCAYAGLLIGICRGMSMAEAAQVASAAGACNVEAADATSGVQSLDATWQRIKSGWAHSDHRLR